MKVGSGMQNGESFGKRTYEARRFPRLSQILLTNKQTALLRLNVPRSGLGVPIAALWSPELSDQPSIGSFPVDVDIPRMAGFVRKAEDMAAYHKTRQAEEARTSR